jgi:hypothetical protein
LLLDAVQPVLFIMTVWLASNCLHRLACTAAAAAAVCCSVGHQQQHAAAGGVAAWLMAAAPAGFRAC